MLQDKDELKIKQIAQDTQNLQYETVLTATALAKKILDRLKYKSSNNNLRIDLEKNPSVQINVDGKPAFKAVEGKKPQYDNLPDRDLQYINRALDLKAGEKVPHMDRNVSIKIDDREVFRLRNGVVEINQLEPERTQAKNQKAEPSKAEPTASEKSVQKEESIKDPVARRQDLNHLAAASTAGALVEHFGKENEVGTKVFEGNAYRMEQSNEGSIKVDAHDGRGTILEFGDGHLQGNMTEADISQFQHVGQELDNSLSRSSTKEQQASPEPVKKDQLEIG